jgi:hypothetical protein
MKPPISSFTSKKLNSILLAIAIAFLFASLIATFSAADYHYKTRTAPLVTLTLSQPACAYISQYGIATDDSNCLCTLTTRYRGRGLGNSGAIEVAGKPPLRIGEGFIVASVELDDGRNEPWSEEHKTAFRYMLGSVFLMLIALSGVAVMAIRSTRK